MRTALIILTLTVAVGASAVGPVTEVSRRRTTLALVPFQSANLPTKDNEAPDIVTGLLQSAVLRSGKYDIVERTRTSSVFSDIGLAAPCGVDCALVLGDQLEVPFVLLGEVSRFDRVSGIQVQIVDVEKEEVLKLVKVTAGTTAEVVGKTNELASKVVSLIETRQKQASKHLEEIADTTGGSGEEDGAGQGLVDNPSSFQQGFDVGGRLHGQLRPKL